MLGVLDQPVEIFRLQIERKPQELYIPDVGDRVSASESAANGRLWLLADMGRAFQKSLCA